MKKSIIKLVIFLLFIVGCQEANKVAPKTFLQKSNDIEKINLKVSQGFDKAEDLKQSHSKWYDREEKLPLTIIATAYINPEVLDTKEYKLYTGLVKKIAKNPKLLGDVSKKYSSVKYVNYLKNSEAKRKFIAAYKNRFNDKEVLTDILRPDNETPSQELLIRINYDELKKGNLTIEGYKTVKEKNKKRNSYYYVLRKVNYSKLSKEKQKEAIYDSLVTILQLSIPEYVSINRDKLIKKDKALRFLKANGDGTYTGEVWKFSLDNEIKKVKDEILKAIINWKVLKALKGHTSSVYSVAISPDGNYALSGSGDKTIRYWDLKTGKTLKILKGHNDDVYSVAISDDGRYALSGSSDKTIRYWDLRTGETLKILKGHTDYVRSVAISSDGKYALSGSYDKIIRYWDLKSGKTLKILKGHNDGVNSVAISDDGKYALSGSSDETIRYWDLKSGKTLKILKGHNSYVESVAISPDGKYALSGSWDKTIIYWDLKTGKPLKIIKGHTDWVMSVAMSSNGRYALSGSGYTIGYWDLKTGKTLTILKGHNDGVSSVAISDDGKYALSGSYDKTIRYWKLIDKVSEEKIKKLEQKIKELESLRIYIDSEKKQLLYTTTLPIQDIDTLQTYNYISIDKNNITKKEIDKIAKVLDSSIDEVLLGSLNSYRKKLDANIKFIDKTLVVDINNLDLDNLYLSSFYNLENNGYKLLYKNENIKFRNNDKTVKYRNIGIEIMNKEW